MSDEQLDQPPTSQSQAVPVVRRLMNVAKVLVIPIIALAVGVALLAMLGVAQRIGWIRSVESSGNATATAASDVDYICPMMCTPPQKEPGRCPVCAMELVPASGGASGGDERSVVVDPATRRVANIQTSSVQLVPVARTIRAVGEISYDEGKMKTISAYTRGRFDRMYVDYIGAVVKRGDRLASFYSPNLYSAQVEYLQAVDASSRSESIKTVAQTNTRLRQNARQRLIEFGMSEAQVESLVKNRKATSRLDIVAPIHGTVIERLAVEGEYVQEGQPVFRLADLSTVWLMLELFPQDASAIRYGQSVAAKLKSMPDRSFDGRVAFVGPAVNKQSRTVSVRVVLDNSEGLIRIGDYAKATIDVPLVSSDDRTVYDPELAGKWISPRHPHIISDNPGRCAVCGVDLVPASTFGYTSSMQDSEPVFVVPRSAVLTAAAENVVYVETETGRFEIRRVEIGPTVGEQIVILKGVAEGEKVATSGNFLLDSQMQLAGNPSLIDPTRAAPPTEMIAGFSASELAEIQQLSEVDQKAAIDQVICPVTEYNLGSMGVPKKVEVNNKSVFICCMGCREPLLEEPEVHLAKLEDFRRNGPSQSPSTEEFDVPEIGTISPIDGGSDGFPEIEFIDDDGGFNIEVPAPTDALQEGAE